MYASGTRTVRGLEAIATSFPPIPSVSVLRRPRNEGIATWGGVMRRHGYRRELPLRRLRLLRQHELLLREQRLRACSTARDMRTRALREHLGRGGRGPVRLARSLTSTSAHSAGKPFFSIVMTTSNHKPFTFRDGVPGVRRERRRAGGRRALCRFRTRATSFERRASATGSTTRCSWSSPTMARACTAKRGIPLHTVRNSDAVLRAGASARRQ